MNVMWQSLHDKNKLNSEDEKLRVVNAVSHLANISQITPSRENT